MVVVALGAWLSFLAFRGQSPTEIVPAPLPAIVSPPVAEATVPPPAPVAPSFDVVRVAPDGSAVFAGRAEPGAVVTVQNAGHDLGQTKATASGAWVLTPDERLPPGASRLTLSARSPDGSVLQSDTPVVTVVPTPIGPALPPLAFMAPPNGPSRLMGASGGKLGLDTVDYDEQGQIRFSGSAPPGAPVRLYVDNRRLGDARAGPDGHWVMSPPGEVKPGLHTLRLDQITPRGQVAARVEAPFQRETLALSQVADGKVLVEPGQSLWRLAQRVYGSGLRYTVIYQANREQIRNQQLIFPGQVFAVPDGPNP